MDEEATIIHTGTSEYFCLNKMGTVLWNRLSDSPCTAQDLGKFLASIFNDQTQSMNGDIERFLENMIEAELIIDLPAPGHDSNGRVKPIQKPPSGSYEAPEMVRFGNLETLILSGE